MTTIEQTEVNHWVEKLKSQLTEMLGDELQQSAMIGIRTGGAALGHRLHREFGLTQPFGQLNISFYRDDFSKIGLHPQVGASDIPFEVDEKTIILVDDVLQSGRTVRAALNEIFDYGRPSRVILAVLVDRGGRELPIRPDALGHLIDLDANAHLKLNAEDMSFQILDNRTS